MKSETAELVRRLVAQQIEIYELCDDDRQPAPHAPISAEAMRALEEFFAARGGAIPPSYRVFLEVCDGIDDFSFSYHIYGSQTLLTPSYDELSAEVFEAGTGLTRDSALDLVLIGSHPETTTRLFVDLQHEPIDAGESVLFDGDPGDLSLHPSFIAYMRMRVTANEMTITQLVAARDGQLDEE